MDRSLLQLSDSAIQNWLDKVAEISRGEGRFPSVLVYGDCIYLTTVNSEIALEALEFFPVRAGFELKIFVGEKLYFPPPKKAKKASNMIQHTNQGIAVMQDWAQANKRFWKLIEAEQRTNTTSVYSTDSERGYPCLALVPYLGLASGPNRVVAIDAVSRIGKPVLLQRSDVPEVEDDALERSQFIGLKQLDLIRTVQGSGEVASTSYSMDWAPPGKPPRTWHKELVAVPLFNEKGAVTEVVIRTLSNSSDKAYWQAVADLS